MADRNRLKFQTIQQIAKMDSEYCEMLRQCRVLENRYHQVLNRLNSEEQDVIFDFVSHCEGMSWRMLELACQFLDFPRVGSEEDMEFKSDSKCSSVDV